MMGILFMVISGICYSFTGTWTAFVGETDVSDIMMTSIRLFFAVMVSGIILMGRKSDMKMDKSQTKASFVFGISGTALTIWLMSMAVQEMSSGPTTLCNYAYPILVSLAGLLIYHEPFGKYKILASLFMLSGLWLCNRGGTMTLYGTFLGLGSAVTFGLYVFGQEHSAMKEVEPLKLFFYNSLFGLIAALLIAIVSGQFMIVDDLRVYIFMFMGGVLSDMFGTVFMFMGVRQVGAGKAAFLSVLEPGLSVVWDMIFFNSRPDYVSIIGLTLIFLCFVTMVLEPSKKNLKEV